MKIFDQNALEDLWIAGRYAAFRGEYVINIGRSVFFVVVGFILVERLRSNVKEISDDRQWRWSGYAKPSVSLLVAILKIEPMNGCFF